MYKIWLVKKLVLECIYDTLICTSNNYIVTSATYMTKFGRIHIYYHEGVLSRQRKDHKTLLISMLHISVLFRNFL